MSDITIHTTEEISTSLSQLAEVMGQPRERVIEAALKQYISEQAWQIEGIQQAQKSLEKGDGKDFDVVVENLRTRIKHKQYSI